MNIYIKLSRIVFKIQIQYPVEISNSFEKFILSDIPDQWDVEIRFVQGCNAIKNLPECYASEGGHAIALNHNGETIFFAKGSISDAVPYTVCSADLRSMVCYLNTENYEPVQSIAELMQMIPLQWYLNRNGCILFHSAQILFDDKGILFMAPSGTGKTTQSKLWQRYRQAEILCNDRVLMRDLHTYGLPYDGADPVRNPEEHEVHAIVCLGQAKENTITRLRPSKAIAQLMPMVLCDTWDPAVRKFVPEALLRIAASVPVYQLDCTPDEAAVICLENQLRKDGVIT